MKLAAVLLVLWFSTHYLYALFPPELRGAVFNISRSAASIILVCMLLLAIPSKLAVIAGTGLIAEDAQVVGCGLWWMIDPWPVVVGAELCSEKMGLPLGAVGIALLGTVAWHIRSKHAARSAP